MSRLGTCSECGGELPDDGGPCSRCALAIGWAVAEGAPLGPGGLDDLPIPPEELIIADSYRVLEVIGRGAMGVVYKARQQNLDRLVAVKMITAGAFASVDIRKRFAAEARAAASLNHPGIVTLHDWGEHDGCPYFSMEFVPCGSLADLLKHGPVEPSRAAHLIELAARAIHHAHGKGILHRDLKPGNILLDANGVPKVADFGLAKAIDQSKALTLTGEILGTPGYMAPELVGSARHPAGAPSDIYSLGAVLYHLLTGRPPFQGASIWETLKQVVDADPAPPSTLNPNIPEELSIIVLKSLQKLPLARYASADDLADDLRRQRQGEPIRARKSGLLQRFAKWSRRNRALAGSMVLLSLSLLAGSVVSLRFGVVAERSSREAAVERSRAESARKSEEMARENTEGLLYAANMGLAQQAWEQGDYSRLTNLLQETAKFPHRGFEWHYWHRLSRAATHTLVGHAQPVTSVAFSSDDRRLVTGGLDGTVRVWDSGSGAELAALTLADHPIQTVAVSKTNNWFAAGDNTGWMGLWDMTDMRLRTRFALPGTDIRTMEFSPAAPLLFTAGTDNAATAWALPSADRVRTFLGHTGPILALAPSPNGQLIATASADGSVRLWDTQKADSTTRLEIQPDVAASLAFNADGSRLLAGMESGTVRIWNLTNIRQSVSFPVHRAPVTGLAAIPGIPAFVSVSRDCTAKIWHPDRATPNYTLLGHTDDLYGIAVSHDGFRMATAGGDGICKLWNVTERNERITLVPPRNPGWVNDLCMTADGQTVFAGTQDGFVRAWNARRGQVDRVLLDPNQEARPAEVSGLALSADETKLMIGYGSTDGILIDLATGKESRRLKGAVGTFSSIAFSPDGNCVATGGLDRSATIWTLDGFGRTLSYQGHGDIVSDAEFSPDGRYVASCSNDGTARLWDAATGAEIRVFQPPEPQHLYCVAFSPDGFLLASGGNGRSVVVWETATGKVRCVFSGHLKDILQIRFSPDGASLASAAADSAARLWSLPIQREVMVLKGHAAGVKTVAFSSNGRTIATGSWDGTVKVWEAGIEP